MTKVMKDDGSEEQFNPIKLMRSIEKACREAKISEKKIQKIVSEVSGPLIEKINKSVSVKSSDIRKMVLDDLKKISEVAVKSWEQFDKRRGK